MLDPVRLFCPTLSSIPKSGFSFPRRRFGIPNGADRNRFSGGPFSSTFRCSTEFGIRERQIEIVKLLVGNGEAIFVGSLSMDASRWMAA